VTAEEPPPPETIGRFKVLGTLGRGGMGVVYRAHDPVLDRQVAVKVLRPERARNPEQRERFLREVKAMARLAHPNVVRVYEFGVEDERPFFVMDLVVGETLVERVRREGPQAPREAARIVLELARALVVIHDEGLLHRDIKPDNVMLTPQGVPLFTDFGLSKDLRHKPELHLTQAGTLIGTAGYSPPEQICGDVEGMGPASDVFSLGATLYALLTCRPPFEGATLLDRAQATLAHTVALPSLRNAAVPAALDAICLHAMAHESAQRYGSAAEFAADLERFLEGGAPLAPAPPPLEERPNSDLMGSLMDAALDTPASTESDKPPAEPEPAPEPAADPSARGDRHFAAGDFEAALADYGRALEARRDDPQLYVKRGVTLRRLGDPAAALAAYGRALLLDPESTKALVGRGLAALEVGDPSGAVEDLTRALTLMSSSDRKLDRVRAALERAKRARKAARGPGW
jgi:serine/threonine protein kinase